ncbi:MAG: hypothetical protein JWM16_6003 [Verrucomicrobiales bacterium]|nr:hypothetical protein [Verrucomicrobiales bacterium]
MKEHTFTQKIWTQASIGFAATSCLMLTACQPLTSSTNRGDSRVQITRETYHGWKDAIRVRNGKAFIIVVPSIGRVMQFGTDNDEGVLWENTFLYGKSQELNATEWTNYGGDKTWPSPEGEWGKHTGNKQWRPPIGFDGMPAEATVEGDTVILRHAADPSYGITAIRRIQLDPKEAKMLINTTYEVTRPDPIKVGIWVITQLKEPERLFVPVPKTAKSYVNLGAKLPPDLKVDNVVVTKVGGGLMIQGEAPVLGLSRNKLDPYKIGTEASSLLWVGPKQMLRIDSTRVPGGEYPDKGSSAEIYTNPDPLQYIELEMLGPLQTVKQNQSISRVNIYTLLPRTLPTPEAEARKIFGVR